MQTITLKLQLNKPTREKLKMYEEMSILNTNFANWLLSYEKLEKSSSKVFKEFSLEKFPSAIACETVRLVKSKKKIKKPKILKIVGVGLIIKI